MATHTTRRQILFGECDPAGIVFYPRYSEMIDANTTALYCVALGMTHHETNARYNTIGCPMVNSITKYHTPSTYGDLVDVTSEITRIGKSSIGVRTRITHADGRLIMEAEDVRVWAALDVDGKIKAISVPDEVRAKLLA